LDAEFSSDMEIRVSDKNLPENNPMIQPENPPIIHDIKIDKSSIKNIPKISKTDKISSVKNKDIKKIFLPSSHVLESFNQLKRLSITFFSLCKTCHEDKDGHGKILGVWDKLDGIVQEAMEAHIYICIFILYAFFNTYECFHINLFYMFIYIYM
jgi:hypothetical protein